MNLRRTLLFLLVSCATAQYDQRKVILKNPEVDQRCMECICQASTNCVERHKCRNSGGQANYCGPYAISWAYWHDAGQPNDFGGLHDPEICMENKICSERAVRGYMRRYGQDCDSNGVIDCFDFARIHKLGPGQCSSNIQASSPVYWKKFLGCYNRFGYRVKAPRNNRRNRNFRRPYNPPDGMNVRPIQNPNTNVDIPNVDKVNRFGDRLPKQQNTRIIDHKSNDGYVQNDQDDIYGTDEKNINYFTNGNFQNYDQKDKTNYYDQNVKASIYGTNNDNYGQNNANYGRDEKDNGAYDYGDEQIQPRRSLKRS